MLHKILNQQALIKRETLFSELLNWRLSKEQISEAMGIPMGAREISVRNYFSDNGIEFSTEKLYYRNYWIRCNNNGVGSIHI